MSAAHATGDALATAVEVPPGRKVPSSPDGTDPGSNGRPRARKIGWRHTLRRDWVLYAMALVPVLFLLLFRYVPMFGNIIAFRRFRPGGSIIGDEWVGMRYIGLFLNDPNFWNVFANTVILGGLTLLFCF